MTFGKNSYIWFNLGCIGSSRLESGMDENLIWSDLPKGRSGLNGIVYVRTIEPWWWLERKE